MKKWVIVSSCIMVGLLLVLTAKYFTVKYLESHPHVYETPNSQMTQVQARKDYKAQTQFMDGQVSLNISEASDAHSIMEDMHKMTHQKVKADEKWGAIEMSQDNINKLVEILREKDFTDVEFFLEIAEKWQAGDFSEIHLDHNYFWNKQGGTVGAAYGIMSPKEEAEFIRNNFR